MSPKSELKKERKKVLQETENDFLKKMNEHQYKEAHCLMLYKCEACGAMEVLWNSRNGVTPFMISCRHCASSMQHAEWGLDTRRPYYKPYKGQRIFIDLTKEQCIEYTRKRVDAMWDNKDIAMQRSFKTKEEAVKALMEDFDPDKGTPDIIVFEG